MALPVREEQRDGEEVHERERRQPDDDEALGFPWDEREEREVAEEVPVRTRVGQDDGGIGGLAEGRRAHDPREHDDDHDRDERDDRVAVCRIGIERDPSPQEVCVALVIRARPDDVAGD